MSEHSAPHHHKSDNSGQTGLSTVNGPNADVYGEIGPFATTDLKLEDSPVHALTVEEREETDNLPIQDKLHNPINPDEHEDWYATDDSFEDIEDDNSTHLYDAPNPGEMFGLDFIPNHGYSVMSDEWPETDSSHDSDIPTYFYTKGTRVA